MNAETIAFGTELLLGQIADTNASVIARSSPQQITLFKSVGNAVQDAAAARQGFDRAAQLRLDRVVEI
jgi:ornithine cyclodeaminase/alanine dehydrogenase-like protein (mu-crystallin family)